MSEGSGRKRNENKEEKKNCNPLGSKRLITKPIKLKPSQKKM